MKRTQSVLIVGGGIAGLVAASALRLDNISVSLIEKARDWTTAGAGLHLHGNALRELRKIGVLNELLAAGIIQDEYDYADLRNQHEVRVRFPRFFDPAIPSFLSIGRGALHNILLERAKRLGTKLKLDTVFTSMSQDRDEVTVSFSDGTTGHFDLVLGCDGIKSQVRNEVFGPTDPTYTGQGIWRTLLERHPSSLLPKIMYGGAGRMVGVMPINDERVYLFAGAPNPARQRYKEENFVSEMKSEFWEFGGLVPFYLDQIDSSDQLIYTAIEMVEQEPPWHRGRIFLVGDAAHASAPYLAQGAAMAIEDVIVLRALISEQLELEQLQSHFMERRYERAKFIQTMSIRRNDERYQGAEYDRADGAKSDRIIELEQNAQRQIDELYVRLAVPA